MTAELWRESFKVEMPAPMLDTESASLVYARPVHSVKLRQSAAPFVKGGAVGFHESKDFSQFFATHYEWLASAFAKCKPPAARTRTGTYTPIQAISTRELFTLDASGSAVCGTFHRPSGYLGDSPQPYSGSSIGLVFINAFSTPRAYIGDAAVCWAECCALRGYPCFRLDLPGLGDSGGATPPELLSFITAGGYAAAASSHAKELVERFQLSGVIFVGHCAGAVTSIFAAGMVNECKGLILMDPYFHSIAGVGSRLRLRFTSWAKQRRLAAPLSMVYAKIRAIQRALRSNGLPANANLPLLARWRQVASRGLPVLTLMSPDWGTSTSKERADLFDYTGHIQAIAGPAGQVTVQRVHGTDHSFTNHAGQRAFLQHAEDWLLHHFPIEPSQHPAGREAVSSTLNSPSIGALTNMTRTPSLAQDVEVKEP
ncbi:MAG: alpha/beta fold hydrolase [Acidobacteria bacterium]|nr:alpha/beta fold hydrolase [Acidobacteriota bacterium]